MEICRQILEDTIVRFESMKLKDCFFNCDDLLSNTMKSIDIFDEIVAKLVTKICLFECLDDKESQQALSDPLFFALERGFIENTTDSFRNRCELLDFLTGELQVSIISQNVSKVKEEEIKKVNTVNNLIQSLQFFLMSSSDIPNGKIDENSILYTIFTQLDRMNRYLIDSSQITPKMVSYLNTINNKMCLDASLRKELLVQRLEVTVSSLLYSKHIKTEQKNTIESHVETQLSLLSKPITSHSLDSLFKARYNLLQLTDMPSLSSSCPATIKAFRMGIVPNRGGIAGIDTPINKKSLKENYTRYTSRSNSFKKTYSHNNNRIQQQDKKNNKPYKRTNSNKEFNETEHVMSVFGSEVASAPVIEANTNEKKTKKYYKKK
ncbi:hypothetical protein WA158_006071 [Blastocystis sp. Blastoise]